MKIIIKIIGAILGFILLQACDSNNDTIKPNNSLQIKFSSTVTKDKTSRGLPLTSSNLISEFIAYAYYTGNGSDNTWELKNSSASPNFMFQQSITNGGYNTGTNKWEYSPTIYWPAYSDANVTFFAYTPQESSSNGISVTKTTGGLSISYTAPTNCSDQPDLMINVPAVDLNSSNTDAVTIEMKHALTSIGFKAIGDNDYITSIDIENIIASGTVSYDITNDSIVWVLDDVSSETYSATTNNTELSSSYQSVITTDGYLMRPPQTTGDNAKLTLNTHNGTSKTYDISNQVWKAGDMINYNIDLSSGISDLTIDVIANGFVSAYWRYNETGERIIRIDNDGDWKAYLYAIEGSWSSSDILLDYLPSSYSSTPGSLIDSSIEQMTSSESEVSGSGTIAFRIGLDADAVLASSDTYPRFAVVLVEYDDLSKNHLIFLRQGEAPVTIDNYYSFATYNISSTESSTSGVYEFVDYPSVGGGKKQWSPDALVYSSSSSSSSTDIDIDTIANVCPSGYEIPSYSAFYYATSNAYMGGMIADGYYDRLYLISVILDGVGPYYIGESLDSEIAYSGGLIYNKDTYASFFLPFAGYLPIGSESSYTGQRGYYWSTTTEDEEALALTMQFESADSIANKISLSPGQWNSPYYGLSIRPIASE